MNTKKKQVKIKEFLEVFDELCVVSVVAKKHRPRMKELLESGHLMKAYALFKQVEIEDYDYDKRKAKAMTGWRN